MKTRLALLTGFAILGATLLCTVAVYSRLPDMLPIHWNIRGEVDGWASKQIAVLIMPCANLVILGMMVGLPAISSHKFRIETFQKTFNYIMLVIVAMMSYIHLITLLAGLNPAFPMIRVLIGGIFLFLALMGNVLGKTRRNPWMGVRTPWTMANDRVWDGTHRLAGRLMVAVGVIGGVLAVAGVSPIVCFVLLTVSVLYPVFYSYVLYKQMGLGE